jgi:hypothetical protein
MQIMVAVPFTGQQKIITRPHTVRTGTAIFVQVQVFVVALQFSNTRSFLCRLLLNAYVP